MSRIGELQAEFDEVKLALCAFDATGLRALVGPVLASTVAESSVSVTICKGVFGDQGAGDPPNAAV